MFLFIQDDKEQYRKQYTDIEIVTIGALGDTICKAIILFWRIRTLHHFKNHLISQESILSIFMESLFVQWRINAKLNVMSFQCHCKLEWQQHIQFALIPADFYLDICLDHTFTTNYCLSKLIIFATHGHFLLIIPFQIMIHCFFWSFKIALQIWMVWIIIQ